VQVRVCIRTMTILNCLTRKPARSPLDPVCEFLYLAREMEIDSPSPPVKNKSYLHDFTPSLRTKTHQCPFETFQKSGFKRESGSLRSWFFGRPLYPVSHWSVRDKLSRALWQAEDWIDDRGPRSCGRGKALLLKELDLVLPFLYMSLLYIKQKWHYFAQAIPFASS
jgi:hypothetical protein